MVITIYKQYLTMTTNYGIDYETLCINTDVIDIPQYIPPYLEIRYSHVPNGGLGIFAKTNIPKGTFLGNYTGIVYIGDECNTLPINKYQFDTVIRGKNAIIDGMELRTSNWTRFMNCSLSEKQENVISMKNKCTEGTTVYLNQNGKQIELDGAIIFFAIKDITCGDELLFNYGMKYSKQLVEHSR